MSSERHWQEETRFVFRGASHAGASGLCGFIKQHTALQVPAQPPPSAPTAAAPRRPAFRAQPLPQEIDGELTRARDSGRRGDDGDHDGRRLHEGKGYPQELTQPDTCPLRSGPRAKIKSARAVIYSRNESHAVRPADRFHINNRTLLSHDDAAAPHQVAHRGVRRRHPRSPIRSVTCGRKPPRRLRRSAGLARAARLEDAERLRRKLGLGRRLAGAL